jgi:hypothetical protein
MLKSNFQWQNVAFLLLGLVLIIVFKLHPAYVVIVGSVLALLIL